MLISPQASGVTGAAWLADPTTTQGNDTKNEICRYFVQGSCKFGSRCRFSHGALSEGGMGTDSSGGVDVVRYLCYAKIAKAELSTYPGRKHASKFDAFRCTSRSRWPKHREHRHPKCERLRIAIICATHSLQMRHLSPLSLLERTTLSSLPVQESFSLSVQIASLSSVIRWIRLDLEGHRQRQWEQAWQEDRVSKRKRHLGELWVL